MATIFEELMTSGRKISKKVVPTKIDPRRVKVESIKKILEDVDNVDELSAKFETEVDDQGEAKEDDVVMIIDPELGEDEEVPEDAAEDMIGDSIYKCPVCGSNYCVGHDEDGEVTESVDVDEDGVPTQCPICGDDADQILIGVIDKAPEEGEETGLDPVKPDEGSDEEDFDEAEDEFVEEEETEEEKNESLRRARRSISKIRTEAKRPFKKLQKTDDKTKKECKEDLDIEVMDDEDLDAPEVCPECGSDPCICDMSMDGTDVEEVKEEEDEVKVEVKDSTVNMYFDEARLEALLRKVIRENYEGDPRVKVSKISRKGSSLKIEYVVREGRKITKGKLFCEGFNPRARQMKLQVRDKGAFTEGITRRPSFVIECVKVGNKISPVKIQYDYKVKVNESVYRVVGKASLK